MGHWVVAGASRGIGLELARRLVIEGEQVTASLRAGSRRVDLEAALALAGDKARIIEFDTRDEAQIRAAAAEVQEPIDVLMINAGAYGPQRQSTLEMDFPAALDLLSTNALGPLRVAQAFLPQVRRGAHPRIIFMSSVLGSMALSGTFNVAYRASKAALNKIAQCVAEDLRAEGIIVLSLHPGWVRTDMGGPNATLSVAESVDAIIPLVRGLSETDTRRYLDYRGVDIAW